MKDINSPQQNDNRNYDYSSAEIEEREEYSYIIDLVPEKSKVIDLGCGNGSLLRKLIDNKNVCGYGIELALSGVDICIRKGLKVIQGKIDSHLNFPDNEFDYSICNVTIQMVLSPEVLLSEMKRISKYQIISFPNFGFYKNRLDLLLKGRMPKPMLFGYKWFNTGHIHQLSIKDFYELVNDIGNITVLEHKFVKTNSSLRNFLMEKFPNFFQFIPVFLLEKK